jgi:hypothetical protein
MLLFVGLCLLLLFAFDGMAIGVTHRNGLVEHRLSWLTHHYPPDSVSAFDVVGHSHSVGANSIRPRFLSELDTFWLTGNS